VRAFFGYEDLRRFPKIANQQEKGEKDSFFKRRQLSTLFVTQHQTRRFKRRIYKVKSRES